MAFQEEFEARENDGLRLFRNFLKSRYANPGAAYRELGKGEGDVLTKAEFPGIMKKIGFTATDAGTLFRCMDKDFSGEISFAEFKSVMKSLANKERKSGSPRSADRRSSPRTTKVSR